MISIGVTGHRPNRLLVPQRKLEARVRGVLKGLITAAQTEAGDEALDIVSPLAEGCDRIVAHEALALGQRVTAVIPFEQRAYEATFGDAATTADFRELWRVARERVVLKCRPECAEAGYVAVGNVTLARADIVLTLWDGNPANGRGGTPEILQNALEWGIPIIWVHASEDRKPVLLVAAKRGKAVPQLDRVARRGQPMTAALYRRLAAGVSAAPAK